MEKLKQLMTDEVFLDKLESTETVQDAVKLFEENGVSISEDDLICLTNSNDSKGELEEKELDDVSGGVISWIHLIRTTLRPIGRYPRWWK